MDAKRQDAMPVDAQLENLPKPRIVIEEQDWIYLSDTPIPRRIFLTLFFGSLTAFNVWRGVEDNEMMILVTGIGTFGFLYGSLSLYRIKIDLKNKVLHRTSINPLENLIDRVLQPPLTSLSSALKQYIPERKWTLEGPPLPDITYT